MTEQLYRLCPACVGRSTFHDQCDVCGFRGIVTAEEAPDAGFVGGGDPKAVKISISVDSDSDLTYDEVFPDADVPPSTVTADDVIEAMEASGSKTSALRDWGLNDLSISVVVENSAGVRTFASW